MLKLFPSKIVLQHHHTTNTNTLHKLCEKLKGEKIKSGILSNKITDCQLSMSLSKPGSLLLQSFSIPRLGLYSTRKSSLLLQYLTIDFGFCSRERME